MLTPPWLAGVGLGVVTLLALVVRVVGLWPPTGSAVQAPYDDEGVYVMAAQLLRQGIWPYRDFFFAHPPLGILPLAPAVSVSFTEWGSSLSFGLARLLMAGMGSVTVLLVGLTAARIWGVTGGLVAAAVIAFDPVSVANSRHIMLEVPMTLLIAAALLASVTAATKRRSFLLAGVWAGLASLVKAQAVLFGIAQALVLGWRREWRQLGTLVAGLAGAGVVLVPFLLMAGPDRFFRQVVLFQLLRPADGLADTGERLSALLSPGGLLLGLSGAMLGLALAWSSGATRPRHRWWPIALWVGLGLASFLLSRSYYQHYASQLVPGLAVLAGGLGAAATRWSAAGAWRRSGLVAAATMLLAGIVLQGLPPVVMPQPDQIFVTVARYVADAVPPGGSALTTDAQFNYLASRALPDARGGYLVDSYGQLVYAGLGLEHGGFMEAIQRARATRAGATVHEIMWRPEAQALWRDQARATDVVVVHAVGRTRLTPETVVWMEQEFQLAESTRRYDIYRRSGP